MAHPPDDEQTRETLISDQPTRKTTLEGDPSEKQTQETVILTQNRETLPPERSASTRSARDEEDSVKYEIIDGLGRGGFAWVYKVQNLDLERDEAMKILASDLAQDSDVIDRFVKEARTSARFRHQNIIQIFEVQQRGRWDMIKAPEVIRNRHPEPFVFFTMTFLKGETATNLIKKTGRLPQRDAISIALDACNALDYAHGQGVIHRDIKPDNIMVDRKGTAVIMDFGIAKVVDQTRQTAAGTFMGTARYVSPEQARGADIDGRSDLYSLGITLYELVTGRVPFDSDQWMTVLYQHIHEPPPAPEQFFEGIDLDLRAIILKMLAKSQDERFQTADEAGRALNQVFQKLGGKDRRTAAMNQIATRQDQAVGDATVATEIVRQPPVAVPPVRTKLRDRQPAGPTVIKPKKSKAKWWIPILALAGLGAYFGFFYKPATKPTVTPPLPQGKLLVSAFPKGRIVKLLNPAGEAVDVVDPELPQILTLPEGSYTVIISYQGRTLERKSYVAANVALTRINAEFELEEERFLLEDLQ